jgi:hypothetical protein
VLVLPHKTVEDLINISTAQDVSGVLALNRESIDLALIRRLKEVSVRV